MPKLVFSDRSRQDLLDIWNYIADDSTRQADAVLERIHLRCLQLINQPKSGHARSEVAAGLRSLNSDGYHIFHRVRPQAVTISRILHHSRHLDPLGPEYFP